MSTSISMINLHAASMEWSQTILDSSSIPGTASTNLKVLPKGGPEGGPAIEFDPAVAPKASIEIPLSSVDQAKEKFDEIQYDLCLENGYSNISFVTHGFPGDQDMRRHYLKRRFKSNEWDRVRLDLNLDDDSGDPEKAKIAITERKIQINFGKADGSIKLGSGAIKLRIANVRLVRRLIHAEIDPRTIECKNEGGEIHVTYPLKLTNRSAQNLTAEIQVDSKKLKAFKTGDFSNKVELKPAQELVVPVILQCSASSAKDLKPGYAEQTDISVSSPDLQGYTTGPYRGYRPFYIYGFIPPSSKPLSSENGLKKEFGSFDEKKLSASMDWKYTSSKNHKEDSELAVEFARAYRSKNDAKYGREAIKILTYYKDLYQKSPLSSDYSLGLGARLATLIFYEKEFFNHFAEAFLLVCESDLATKEEFEAIRRDFILEMTYRTNRHFHSVSPYQVLMVRSQIKGAMVSGNWFFLADALEGEGGLKFLLGQLFDVNGLFIWKAGKEKDKFPGTALRSIRECLTDLGIESEDVRITQILTANGL